MENWKMIIFIYLKMFQNYSIFLKMKKLLKKMKHMKMQNFVVYLINNQFCQI
uniref:Uncharacterized protein n=1 Tax=Meloidogyne enterolobii TaxID=390850 RepID=A0A6V7V8T1_MELEN|nr:unnamed protein product [Meloidogyne enterolobii]